MPICITCTHPIPYLCTVYQSAYNLRLEQCVSILHPFANAETNIKSQTACNNFADPYVEHDSLTLLLDLILLKRAVYRHLLYNRGVEPRKVGISDGPSARQSSEGEQNEKQMEKNKVCIRVVVER
jgi:lipid intermediate transporter